MTVSAPLQPLRPQLCPEISGRGASAPLRQRHPLPPIPHEEQCQRHLTGQASAVLSVDVSACAACGGDLPAAAAFCPTCGRPVKRATTPSETVRRTVTAVFCDLSGSTALGETRDPELMRTVVTRYFEAVSAVMEQHGGTVEKFIGDAVMSVFGIPELHEDDALRAVRAAAGARDAVAQLNEQLEREHGLRIAVRHGVETGEVVIGDGSRGTVATGDAVNVAARLEQAAAPGEILVGPGTWRLVRDMAHAEAVGPLSMHGKQDGVPAWRLLDVENEQRSSRAMAGTPLIGRTRELSLLRQTFDRCIEERACHVVTLLGNAGVGKTRLLSELLAALPDDVLVLRGRCLSYGDAVGLWPVREILRSAAGLKGGEEEQESRPRIARLIADDADPTVLGDRLAALADLAGTLPSREEANWAMRRFFELVGRSSPLIVVIDDVHWADPVLLDLVDHLADWVRDTPLLLVCVSRPELLDTRPMWGGGRVNATSLLLSPLHPAAAAELVQAIAGSTELAPDVEQRLCAAVAGVPLYAEHLFAMLVERDQVALRDGVWSWTRPTDVLETPPSIAAILAARLDRLDTGQRAVVESASVVGEVFYRGAVGELTAALASDEVDAALGALIRRDLVRTEPSDIAGEEALRFTHVLVRDAAYTAMSKSRRSELHLRLARWLEKRSDAASVVGPFVGHHLAQAVMLRDALGPRDAITRDLADEAVGVLQRAARGVGATDPAAGAALLDRAAAVSEDQSLVARLRLRQVALLRMDRNLPACAAAWRAARVAAQEVGDARLIRMVTFEGTMLSSQLPTVEADTLTDDEIDIALDQAREDRDDEMLLAALRCNIDRLNQRGLWAGMPELADEAAAAADRLGEAAIQTDFRMTVAAGCVFGPMPASQGLARLTRLLGDPELTQRDQRARLTMAQVPLLAMLDREDEARQVTAQARLVNDELHLGPDFLAFMVGYGLQILGDAAAAEGDVRRATDALARIGEVGWRSTLLPMLGELRLAQGDEAEARESAEIAREISPPDDTESQARWRSLLAVLEARAGRLDTALQLADDAIEWVHRGDQTDSTADRHRDRAEVRRAAGLLSEARADLEEAVRLYLEKGNIPSRRRAQAMLDALGG